MLEFIHSLINYLVGAGHSTEQNKCGSQSERTQTESATTGTSLGGQYVGILRFHFRGHKLDPWFVAHQASLSMEFSRQEYWSLSPGDCPYPEIESGSPALQADSLPPEPPGKL